MSDSHGSSDSSDDEEYVPPGMQLFPGHSKHIAHEEDSSEDSDGDVSE